MSPYREPDAPPRKRWRFDADHAMAFTVGLAVIVAMLVAAWLCRDMEHPRARAEREMREQRAACLAGGGTITDMHEGNLFSWSCTWGAR